MLGPLAPAPQPLGMLLLAVAMAILAAPVLVANGKGAKAVTAPRPWAVLREHPETVFVPLHKAACVAGLDGTRARSLAQFRWLHFPKCGTSFATTLLHYACPGLPEDAYPHHTNRSYLHSNRYVGQVIQEHQLLKPGRCLPQYGASLSRNMLGHSPLTDEQVRRGGFVVALFRDPRRRSYSSWLTHHSGKRHGSALHPADPHEYAHLHRGCQARMLLGVECNSPKLADLPWTPQEGQMTEAVRRINSQAVFAFVGLTDYWTETVCLFHAMYGGPVTKHELDNVRPGVARIVGSNVTGTGSTLTNGMQPPVSPSKFRSNLAHGPNRVRFSSIITRTIADPLSKPLHNLLRVQ